MRQPPGDADSVVGEPGHDLNYDESIVYNVSACVLLRVLRVDVQAKERRDPAALPRRVPHALKHKEKHPLCMQTCLSFNIVHDVHGQPHAALQFTASQQSKTPYSLCCS
jgi:hypothetical protein